MWRQLFSLALRPNHSADRSPHRQALSRSLADAATSAGVEPVQSLADSQPFLRTPPILEGSSNFTDEFADDESCMQLNLFDF
jgi:hypothetical protein